MKSEGRPRALRASGGLFCAATPEDAPDRRRERDRVGFAFAFGLVHGFGFASVLGELDLPQGALAWSLAAFNVGVEIGQVTTVLVAAPLLLGLRRRAPARVSRGLLTAAASTVVLVGRF